MGLYTYAFDCETKNDTDKQTLDRCYFFGIDGVGWYSGYIQLSFVGSEINPLACGKRVYYSLLYYSCEQVLPEQQAFG